jgi:hypothetical protein
VLVAQGNLALTYAELGRFEEAMGLRRDVYSGRLKLNGKEHKSSLIAANNYAMSLRDLKRYKEAKSLLRQTWPVARHILGESHELTLKVRKNYATTLHNDPGATLDDFR